MKKRIKNPGTEESKVRGSVWVYKQQRFRSSGRCACAHVRTFIPPPALIERAPTVSFFYTLIKLRCVYLYTSVLFIYRPPHHLLHQIMGSACIHCAKSSSVLRIWVDRASASTSAFWCFSCRVLGSDEIKYSEVTGTDELKGCVNHARILDHPTRGRAATKPSGFRKEVGTWTAQ